MNQPQNTWAFIHLVFGTKTRFEKMSWLAFISFHINLGRVEWANSAFQLNPGQPCLICCDKGSEFTKGSTTLDNPF